nr:immunoglobulin light chain junction region [Macaca mulatta]MPO03652.1 immunoglobulin light chain junction region [Macaca mulatta]MPO04469.1 immunoglobulin light chain junction region [Macaca mulatta]MPO04636.1 immunoglobulin light chain junction region [Macaca mulatta]MPO04773.1 immunoglobulin light chain junction region [Macaca mulatta]
CAAWDNSLSGYIF